MQHWLRTTIMINEVEWKKDVHMNIQPYIINTESLSDDLLIQCYRQAIRLQCDERFIQILKDSLHYRNLTVDIEVQDTAGEHELNAHSISLLNKED